MILIFNTIFMLGFGINALIMISIAIILVLFIVEALFSNDFFIYLLIDTNQETKENRGKKLLIRASLVLATLLTFFGATQSMLLEFGSYQ